MRDRDRPSQVQEGHSAVSEADGSFRFEGLESGDYRLSGERAGFLRTQYGATAPMRMGTTVALRPGQQLTNLTLALIPQGVVSGKVVDEDGDPVGGAMVRALRQRWIQGKLRYLPHGGNSTSDLGEFRIANLSAGKYYIYCEKTDRMMAANDAPASPDKPDIRPVRTFYPDATSRDGATPIEIQAGQEAAGTDIRLRSAQTHRVRGKVVGDLPEGDAEGLTVHLMPQDDDIPMFFGGRGNIDKNRRFELAGVAPGKYTISILGGSGAVRSLGRQSIEVGATDLDGVVLAIVPAGTLHGQIHMDGTSTANAGAANPSQVRPYLVPADSTSFFGGSDAKVKADGTFTLDDVSPGKYRVEVMNTPDGSYLKSIRFGEREVLGKELDLSHGISGELAIVLRYGAAEVDGTVEAAQDTTAPAGTSAAQSTTYPGAQVVLVPDMLNSDGSGSLFRNTNQYGNFSVKQVRPGHYHAYAFEQIDTDQLQNPFVLRQLENRGTEVDVKENDKKQIQLPLIGKSAFEQLLVGLGIEAQ